MLSFFQVIEAMAIPRSMGTARQVTLPAQKSMPEWDVTFLSNVTRTRVVGQSPAEVRRMVWEHMKEKFPWAGAELLTLAAKSCVVKQQEQTVRMPQLPEEPGQGRDARSGTYG